MKAPWPLLLPLPLLLTAAPSSYLAHDEGYYALQARWMLERGDWLAPWWWSQPLYDRSIGAQWGIATSFHLLGFSPQAAHLPSLLAAAACLALTYGLALALAPGTAKQPQAGLWARMLTVPVMATTVLALTPLWLDYAHLATQDMPLLAVELLGLLALVRSRTGSHWAWPSLAGASLGLGFLIKGFMVALPLLAVAPFLWLARRSVLQRPALWAGVALGAVPVLLWLILSVQEYGMEAVSGLWKKLLFLSGSDVYNAGPFYYLWNVPANTAPWLLAAAPGWWRGLRGRWSREQLLLQVTYPLLLLVLLSCFRTKTPYYGLQLTPFIALAAAEGLQVWAQRPHRWIDRAIAGLGAVLVLAAIVLAVPATGLASRLGLGSPPATAALIALAALGLGAPWLTLAWGHRSRQLLPGQRLTLLLLGPWLALVLLVQGGLFTDRSPHVRLALTEPKVQALLNQLPVQVVAPDPLSGAEHAQLILLALGTPQLGQRLEDSSALQPGQRAWMRWPEGPTSGHRALRVLASGEALGSWSLVEQR